MPWGYAAKDSPTGLSHRSPATVGVAADQDESRPPECACVTLAGVRPVTVLPQRCSAATFSHRSLPTIDRRAPIFARCLRPRWRAPDRRRFSHSGVRPPRSRIVHFLPLNLEPPSSHAALGPAGGHPRRILVRPPPRRIPQAPYRYRLTQDFSGRTIRLRIVPPSHFARHRSFAG